MRNITKTICISLVALFGTTLFAADCNALRSKYEAPDPGSKTMAQIKRWVKKVEDPNDAKELEKCMVALAADNPNKAQVAGK